MQTATETSGEWQCSNAEYHADCSRVGKGMLDDFRRSRRLYEARYVTKTMPRGEQSNGMLRGSCLHMRVLEPERYGEIVRLRIEADRRTKHGREMHAAQEHLAKENGWILIDADMFQCVERMASAIFNNDVPLFLLKFNAKNEHTIVWTDPYTGLECKSRRDRVGERLIVDLKSCEAATPFAFSKAAAYYGYHRQAAFYLDGHKQVTGEDGSFVFIVTASEPPYQAAVYELDDAAIERGRQENRDALTALASCIESGDWSDPYERQFTRLSLPDWAMRDDWRLA